MPSGVHICAWMILPKEFFLLRQPNAHASPPALDRSLGAPYLVLYLALAAALWVWSGDMDVHGKDWEDLKQARRLHTSMLGLDRPNPNPRVWEG